MLKYISYMKKHKHMSWACCFRITVTARRGSEKQQTGDTQPQGGATHHYFQRRRQRELLQLCLRLFFSFLFLICSSKTLIPSRVWQLSHRNRRNEERRIMAQKWHTVARRPRGPRGALGAAVTQPIWTLGASDNWIAHENANMRTNNLEGTTRGEGEEGLMHGWNTWMIERDVVNEREGIGEADKVWSEIINWGKNCFYLHVNHLFFYRLGGKKFFRYSQFATFAIFWKIGLSTCTWKNKPELYIFLKTTVVKTTV